MCVPCRHWCSHSPPRLQLTFFSCWSYRADGVVEVTLKVRTLIPNLAVRAPAAPYRPFCTTTSRCAAVITFFPKFIGCFASVANRGDMSLPRPVRWKSNTYRTVKFRTHKHFFGSGDRICVPLNYSKNIPVVFIITKCVLETKLLTCFDK